MSVFELDLAQLSFEEGHCVVMLGFPLFSDLFLVHHHSVRLFLIGFVAFLGLQKNVLQVGNLNVGLVIKLVDATVEHNLEPADLAYCALLLIAQLINQFSQAFVVIKVAFIITHVRVQFDLLLVLHNLAMVLLILQILDFFLQAFVFLLEIAHLFIAHGFLLV